MPVALTAPSIPVPTQANLVACVNALRSNVIALQGLTAARGTITGALATGSNSAPAPSQFVLQSTVFRNVTFPASGTDTITIPVLMSATWINMTTNETVTYTAPAAATAGGTVGNTL